METEVLTRTCGFCFRVFTYDELPENSICYLGIMVCGTCLEKEATENFRELIKETETRNTWKLPLPAKM